MYVHYLYSLMTLVWELDMDTHNYFRQYLDVFIKQRKISKEVKGFIKNSWTRGQIFSPHIILPLRYGLPKRIYRNEMTVQLDYHVMRCPMSIDKIHPPKYYLEDKK